MPLIRRILRPLCALVLVAIGSGVLYFVVSSSPDAVNKDVLQYWAASRLLIHRSNPYDETSVLQLEREAGAPISRAQIMFNPPCVLSFVLPMGLFSARMAIFLWGLFIVACLMLSIRILWIMNGRRTDRLHLLIYVFAPVLACVVLGQVVPVALLGLTLFLWLHRSRPLLAGLAIPLLSVKPHLLLAFGVVLLIWAVKEKQLRFLTGILLGLTVACLIPLGFDSRIFAEYLPALHSANKYSHGMPNLSSLLHLLSPGLGILQYTLALASIGWAVWWYFQRHRAWNWNDQGLLLIALSVVVAPYSWFEDEALMIPAVLYAIYRCYDSDRSLISFGILDGAALALVLFNVQFLTGAYIWTSLAWFAWYCYVRFGIRLEPGIRNDVVSNRIAAVSEQD